MKKFLLMLMLMFTCSFVNAQQVLWFKTTEMAIKLQGYEWSDWTKAKMNVKFDLTNDIIVIYSEKTQIYKVLGINQTPYDPNGRQVAYSVIDQDYDRGQIRLRIENNGNSQIYVDFSDVSWVYNVYRVEK